MSRLRKSERRTEDDIGDGNAVNWLVAWRWDREKRRAVQAATETLTVGHCEAPFHFGYV